MNKTNKEKARAWRQAQRAIETQEAAQVAVDKSIRRHNGIKHETNRVTRWAHLMGVLSNIHKELAPKINAIRQAEDFLFYTTGRHAIGKHQVKQ